MPDGSSPFRELERGLREVGAFLHGFTQGQRGFTPQDVLAGISRARRLCEQLEAQHGTGMRAAEVATVVETCRQQISAAKAKLEGKDT